MFEPSLYHCIGSSVSRRASLLAKLAKDLVALEEKDAKTSAELLEMVPEDLREWVEDEGPLPVLYEYGTCEFKIYFGGDCYFRGHADVKEKMQRLATAWKDVVSIKLDKPESGRVYARFIAIM